jgi:hypothetical protein
MPSRLFSLIALLCLSCALYAQSQNRERYQVYGGYTFLSNTLNGVAGSHQPLNGAEGSLAFPAWHNLRFKVDAYFYRGTNLGAPQHPFYILGGGQYSWHVRRESVYVEALAGDSGANKTWGTNATGQTASFAALLGGGLDTPISRRFAFRVSGGYQYSYFELVTPWPNLIPYRIPGLPTNFMRLSSGLVWHF